MEPLLRGHPGYKEKCPLREAGSTVLPFMDFPKVELRSAERDLTFFRCSHTGIENKRTTLRKSKPSNKKKTVFA